MKPIKTRHTNREIGKNQDQYNTLPAFKDADGTIISCWELSDDDLQKVIENRCVYLRQLTFNQPMQPVSVMIENPVLDFIPFKQTRLNTEDVKGNCYSTVIAAIIGADSPEDVIQVQELGINSWKKDLEKWLGERGWNIKTIDGHLSNFEPYFVIGESPRDSNITHICIYQNGEMVHDPHPENTGIKSTLEFIQITRKN